MALKISPRNELDSILVGTKCSQTLDVSKKLKINTIASYSYKIFDSSDNEVTDTFGGGSSISSNIITFGIKAISAGTYTLQFIITCNEVLPDGRTPREFYITMTMQIIATILVEEESAFIFDVQTTGASETFSLPLESSGTYDFNADWGDNSDDDITVWNQGEVTHTYVSAGTYEIKITGTIIGWRFNYNGDCSKIYELKSWGPLRLGNNGRYFYGCANLTITATDILDLTGTTDLTRMLADCYVLTTIPSMNSWDVSAVTKMDYMFVWSSLFNQDISSWNTVSVISMSSMLDNAVSFDQNIGAWPITSVTDFYYFLDGVTLSTANYDALLIGWESQAVQDNVNFHGGNSKYSAGAAATARQALIDDHAWQIQDGGQV